MPWFHKFHTSIHDSIRSAAMVAFSAASSALIPEVQHLLPWFQSLISTSPWFLSDCYCYVSEVQHSSIICHGSSSSVMILVRSALLFCYSFSKFICNLPWLLSKANNDFSNFSIICHGFSKFRIFTMHGCSQVSIAMVSVSFKHIFCHETSISEISTFRNNNSIRFGVFCHDSRQFGKVPVWSKCIRLQLIQHHLPSSTQFGHCYSQFSIIICHGNSRDSYRGGGLPPLSKISPPFESAQVLK